MKEKIVVFTGAGISKESGIPTYRDADDSLWKKYNADEVATSKAWETNPKAVLDFCQMARDMVFKCEPNEGHYSLVKLEEKYNVLIVTQNIDNLHERAGSKNVIHLHGNILESRSSKDAKLIYKWEKEKKIELGELCEDGSQLRPNVVLFGEPVQFPIKLINFCHEASCLLIIGTSLNVYPAANIVTFVPPFAPIYIVDPGECLLGKSENRKFIKEPATKGVPIVVNELLKNIKI